MKRALAVLALVGFGGVMAVGGVALWATRAVQGELPQLEDKLAVVDVKPSVIVAADGSEIYRVTSLDRKPFRLADVPQRVRDAFLAAEDRRFYEHSGVDPIGVGRALFTAVKDRRASQGGSTLTMQLAKLLVTGNDRTFERKLKDVALAFELEKIKTKDQILELYLKTVYFGDGAYGLRSAADTYFGKRIDQLTLSEAATLARCVRRPSDQNPRANKRVALRNRDVVLGILLEDGKITKAQYDAAKRDPLKLAKADRNSIVRNNVAPFFVDDVLARVREDFPDVDFKQGGYRIETTLRPKLQRFADRAVAQVVRRYRRANVSAGCFLLMNAQGEILAMVGGTDYGKSQVNVVTDGLRQPGSSFKPLVYATGVATGKLDPNGSISNAPIEYRDPSRPGGYWRPKNSGRGENASSYPIGTALALSVNRSAIHALEETGVRPMIQYAEDVFGIRSKLDPVLPLALGASAVRPIEMAEAYTVFLLRGDRVRPQGLKRVVGPDGEVLRTYSPTKFQAVLEPEVCDHVDGWLRQVVTSGTASRFGSSVPDARGKTGTTSSHKDAWFCGYAHGLLGVGWVGNLGAQPMTSEVFGGTVTLQFWAAIMNEALEQGLGIQEAVVPREGGVPAVTVTSAATEEERPRRREPEDAPPDEPAPRPRPATTDETPRPTDELPPSESFPSRVPPLEPAPRDPAPRDPSPGDLAPADEVDREAARRDRERVKEREREREKDKEKEKQKDKARDRARRRAEERRAAREDDVTVEICIASGKRATPYCPETEVRTFPKGKAPRGSCPIHRDGG